MGYNILVEKYDGKRGWFGHFESGGFCFGYSQTDSYFFTDYAKAKEACDKLNSFLSVKKAEIIEK